MHWVGLEHDTMWGRHMVPLTVWVGRQVQEGRGLVAFGSTHGNEYEGPTALKRLLAGVILGLICALGIPDSQAHDKPGDRARPQFLVHYMPWFESKEHNGKWGLALDHGPLRPGPDGFDGEAGHRLTRLPVDRAV